LVVSQRTSAIKKRLLGLLANDQTFLVIADDMAAAMAIQPATARKTMCWFGVRSSVSFGTFQSGINRYASTQHYIG